MNAELLYIARTLVKATLEIWWPAQQNPVDTNHQASKILNHITPESYILVFSFDPLTRL